MLKSINDLRDKRKKNRRLTKHRDIDLKVLLWAYEKRNKSFTWSDIQNEFELNQDQIDNLKRLFLTNSDGDRRFFEYAESKAANEGMIDYLFLNEKGTSAAINYKALNETRIGNSINFYLTILVVGLSIATLLLQKENNDLAEMGTVADRLKFSQDTNTAKEMCKATPEGMSIVNYIQGEKFGQPIPCSELLK